MWPNSENWVGKQTQHRKFVHLSKIKTTSSRQFCRFEINGQVTKAYIFKAIYAKRLQKWALTSFLSELSHQSIQNQNDFRYPDLEKWFSSFLNNRFLFKERHLNFSYIAHPMT